jgi:hypothetical protein
MGMEEWFEPMAPSAFGDAGKNLYRGEIEFGAQPVFYIVFFIKLRKRPAKVKPCWIEPVAPALGETALIVKAERRRCFKRFN